MNLLQLVTDQAMKRLPESVRATLFVRGFGLTQVPFIFLVAPKVLEMTEARCVVRLPLNWLTRNHLGSMYLGVLTMGADITGGLIALETVRKTHSKVGIVFKDMQAIFKRRPTSAVRFVCEDGLAIGAAVALAASTGVRQELPVHVSAQVRGDEVASFVMTLSLKQRSRELR